MKVKLLRFISLLSIFMAAGAISGASRSGSYQGDEAEVLKKMKKI